MRVIYRKISHARYLYIKRNVEKVWGARYLSKNTVVFSRDNSVDIATRVQAERPRTLVWFTTKKKKTDIFLLCKVPSLALGSNQCPARGILVAVRSEVQQPVHGANHSLPSGAKAESIRSYISALLHTLMAWFLIKHGAISSIQTFYWPNYPSSFCGRGGTELPPVLSATVTGYRYGQSTCSSWELQYWVPQWLVTAMVSLHVHFRNCSTECHKIGRASCRERV